ncbi:MAG: hypothetical protein ABJ360_14130 [Roseobacter sp.]
MTENIHPMAPHYLPFYFAGPDGSDSMFTTMTFLLIAAIALLGVFYFTLHSLPERMAHKSNATQLQLISILCILALFTHNNIFWVAALVLAAFRPPDFGTPLNSIAESLQKLANRVQSND